MDESLRRLQTDHIDLLQFHEVIRDNPILTGFLRRAAAWKQSSKPRSKEKSASIGFTGHKSPDIHLKMLNAAFAHQFTFDAVQMPLNVMDAHYDSFEKKVLPVLVQHEHRRSRDEADGRQDHSQEQDRDGGRVPALLDEPAHQRGHQRLRLDEHPAAALDAARSFRSMNQSEVAKFARQDRPRCRQRRIRTL